MDFNKEAVNWDTEDRARRAALIAGEIRKALPEGKYTTAMEFGCGTGLVGFHLRDRFEDMLLIDNSPGMIEELNRKIQAQSKENMHGICHDILLDGPLGQKADVIFTSMALHHVVQLDETLSRIGALLQTGGMLCIVDLIEDGGRFHQHEKNFDGHHGFDPEALGRKLQGMGFSEVEDYVFLKGTKNDGAEQMEYELFLLTGVKG